MIRAQRRLFAHLARTNPPGVPLCVWAIACLVIGPIIQQMAAVAEYQRGPLS